MGQNVQQNNRKMENRARPECIGNAHRHSLMIFHQLRKYHKKFLQKGSFPYKHGRHKSRSLAIFHCKEIVNLGAQEIACFWAKVPIRAATEEIQAILVHSANVPCWCSSFNLPGWLSIFLFFGLWPVFLWAQLRMIANREREEHAPASASAQIIRQRNYTELGTSPASLNVALMSSSVASLWSDSFSDLAPPSRSTATRIQSVSHWSASAQAHIFSDTSCTLSFSLLFALLARTWLEAGLIVSATRLHGACIAWKSKDPTKIVGSVRVCPPVAASQASSVIMACRSATLPTKCGLTLDCAA